MYITRSSISEHPNLAPLFYTFPNLTSWSSRDLYSPHPTIPNLWHYVMRADDVIVFSTGEKLQPTDIEQTVEAHEKVRHALVVGQQRLVPGLIVEPVSFPKTEKERRELMGEIWPTVKAANTHSPSHAQIGQEFIIIASEDKPFKETPKTSIQKAATLKLYEREIEAVYANAQKGGDVATDDVPVLDVDSEEGMVRVVMNMVRETLNTKAVKDADTDFFSAGFDSLQVIRSSRLLAAAFKSQCIDIGKDAVAPWAIYAHPTPRKLAMYLLSLAKGTGEDENAADDVETMGALLRKYTAMLPAAPPAPKTGRDTKAQTILVTGTTGSLGTALLASLIRNPSVASIICFNRGADGGESKLPSPSIVPVPSEKSITFHQADLSAPNLGLSPPTYSTLLDKVDTAIHLAWPVNFNIPLSTFIPNIAGVSNLIRLASSARKRAHIVFISSIAEVNASTRSSIPESALPESEAFSAAVGGYGQSKVVSSLLLDAAREKSGVSSAVIRVGQIAGARTDEGVKLGKWNKAEWFPSIIASSVYLGVLPSSLGTFEVVDWTPIEDVVGMITDVAGVNGSIKDDQGEFHCVNPSTCRWSDLAPVVKNFYGDSIKNVVDFGEWIEALENSAAEGSDLAKNPAVKLLDTYREMNSGKGGPRLEMNRTMGMSNTIKNVGAVDKGVMERWCREWAF